MTILKRILILVISLFVGGWLVQFSTNFFLTKEEITLQKDLINSMVMGYIFSNVVIIIACFIFTLILVGLYVLALKTIDFVKLLFIKKSL